MPTSKSSGGAAVGTGGTPVRAKTDPSQNPSLWGINLPVNQGWDARTRANAPRPTETNASGYLHPHSAPEQKFYIWLDELAADFSLHGEMGQSQLTREFFPRSFEDVVIRLTGTVASQQHYNELAKFVRQAQWDALNPGLANTLTAKTSPLLNFHLYDHTPAQWRPAGRDSDVRPNGSQGGATGISTVKGRHRPWHTAGYVKSIDAGATHWEVAPSFVLQLIIAESTLSAGTGVWEDSLDTTPTAQPDILQLIGLAMKNPSQGGFIPDPVAAVVKADTNQDQQGINHAVNYLPLKLYQLF